MRNIIGKFCCKFNKRSDTCLINPTNDKARLKLIDFYVNKSLPLNSRVVNIENNFEVENL